MTESHNQRLCKNCKEWYDARASACYLCGTEASDHNEALVAARLNGALSQQVANANADARAEAQFRQAHRTGSMETANRPLNGYPGYGSLVGSIKRQLKEAGFGE